MSEFKISLNDAVTNHKVKAHNSNMANLATALVNIEDEIKRLTDLKQKITDAGNSTDLTEETVASLYKQSQTYR